MQVTVSMTFESEAAAAAFLSGGKASGATSTSSTKGETKTGPKYNRDQLAAAMDKLKGKTSPDVCRALIAEAVGKPTKLAEVPEDKIDAVYTAATAKLAEAEKAASEEV